MSVSWTVDGKPLHIKGSSWVACIRNWFGIIEAEENPSEACQGLIKAGVETRTD